MDILERIIDNLTSDEVRRFKILSNRFKADEEKKLLILFDAIRAGNFKDDEDEVIRQLYGDTTAKVKNSYYRLRNKLLSNLEKSLLFYHFNYKNTIESYSNIQLAILFKEKGIYREAYHYLKKAEKVATKYDQFNVLEVIYDEMVHLAASDVDIDVQEVIKRRKANTKKIELLRSSSEVIGVIQQQIRKFNFSRSKKGTSVIELLESAKSQLEEHKDIFNSGTGKITIYNAVANILLQKKEYEELNDYLKKTFKEFEDEGVFDRNTHETRIKMRIYRINSLRKLRKFKEEGKQLDLLWKDLKMYGKQNFNEYSIFYFISKITNDQIRDRLDESGDALKKAFKSKEILQRDYNLLLMYLHQTFQYFYQGLYARGFEVFNKLLAHPKFSSNFGEELQFYISIFELINAFEGNNYGYVDAQYKKFKKKYKAFLKDSFYEKAQKFVEILIRMNTAAIEGKKVFLKSAHKNFVESFPPSEIADNQIIMYEVYLLSKLEEKTYYQAFLEEVNNRR